jgi:hypothetical protein
LAYVYKGDCATAPQININTDTGSLNTFKSKEFKISALITSDLRVICPTATLFNYTWTATQVSSGIVQTFTGKSILVPSNFLLSLNSDNVTFDLKLSMVHPNGILQTNGDITIGINMAPIVVALRDGNSRLASTSSVLRIDGTSTYDPDDPCSITCNVCHNCASCISCRNIYPSRSPDSADFGFVWSCITLDDSNSCPTVFESLNPWNYTLFFESNTFAPGRYRIFLRATKQPGNRVGNTSLVLEMKSGSVPDVFITRPDSGKINPSRITIFQGAASLPYISAFSFRWNVTWARNGTPLNLSDPDISSTGSSLRNLVINSNIFTPEESFIVSLIAVGKSGESGFSSITVTVNGPPLSGTCFSDISSGFDLNTTFTLKCQNWVDLDLPLSYLFFYQRTPEGVPVPLQQAPSTNGSISTLLKSGLKDRDYMGFIIGRVYDSLGAFSEVMFNITVKSVADADASAAIDSAKDIIQNQLSSVSTQGDVGQVMQLASVLTGILNTVSTNASEETSSGTADLRNQLLSIVLLSNDPTDTSASSIAQSASLINEITSVPSQVTSESQASTANFLKSVTENIKTTGVDPETSRSFLGAFGNLIGAAQITGSTSSNVTSQENGTDTTNTVRNLVSSISNVGSALLVGQVPGSKPVNVVTKEIVIAAQVSKGIRTL